jgi:hypothetical protein
VNLQLLVDELRKPQYQSMTDAQAAAAVNAKTVAIRQLVPNWKIKQTAILAGYWAAVKAGQLSANTIAAGLCVSVIDWVTDPKIESTDMDIPGVQQMIDGLLTFGFITTTQANDLDALADSTKPWTQSVGLDVVGDGHVRSARLEIGVTI